ncbi:MAG TPA: ABC transporter ATP-binding protein [Caldilineae bacterium]|nr:ABC transporter ATP-binding protein [Caldilineae bacterium]
MGTPLVVCEELVKIYQYDGVEIQALSGLDLEVYEGEVLAIVGPSGSGKSTLMNILGGLDRPTSGKVMVGDIDLLSLDEPGLVRYRREVVGFVWQQNARNLLPYLTTLENVCVPMRLAGLPRREQLERAWALLEAVGLADRAYHGTTALSGGEQQRAAIAIALANSPALLLADEPTGSVDSETAGQIIDLFRHLGHTFGVTVIIVTHDPLVAHHADRAVEIRDGRTSFERIRRDRTTFDEYLMVDQEGRVRLPPHVIERLRIGRRVRVHLRDDHLELWPVEEE